MQNTITRRSRTPIIWSNIFIIAIHVIGVIASLQLGVSKDEILKALPPLVSSALSALIALNIGFASIRNGFLFIRPVAAASQWTINVTLDIHNNLNNDLYVSSIFEKTKFNTTNLHLTDSPISHNEKIRIKFDLIPKFDTNLSQTKYIKDKYISLYIKHTEVGQDNSTTTLVRLINPNYRKNWLIALIRAKLRFIKRSWGNKS